MSVPNADDSPHTIDPTSSLATPGKDSTADFGSDFPLSNGNTVTETTGGEPVNAEPKRASRSVTVPGYEIKGVLGRGGMGVVYKARHLALKRPVALKMMLTGGHAGPRELRNYPETPQNL